MHIETIIGIAASACTAASMLPQLAMVLKEKKADNVSLGMILVLFAGLILWVYYGFLRKDRIIIISNCFSVVVNISLAFFAIKYKSKR